MIVPHQSAEEILSSVSHRIRILNRKTGEGVPDMYYPSDSETKDSLLRMRRDLDSLQERYDFVEDDCSLRFYFSTKERIEACADMI